MKSLQLFLIRIIIFFLPVLLTSGSQRELYLTIKNLVNNKPYHSYKKQNYVYADSSGCSDTDSDSGGCSDTGTSDSSSSNGGCDDSVSDSADFETENYWDDSSSDDSGGCSDNEFKCSGDYTYDPNISIHFVSVITTPTVITVNLSGANESSVPSIAGMIRVIRFSNGASISFNVVEISPIQYQIINFNPVLISGEKYSFIFLEGAFHNNDGVSPFHVIRYTVP